MKRGFTLIEMMLAATISVLVLGAILGMLTGVWRVAKESSDELQGALHARAMRERLYYNLLDDAGAPLGYGLSSATNIVFVNPTEILASFNKSDSAKQYWRADFSKSADCARYMLDITKTAADFSSGTNALQYVYVSVALGHAHYLDRVVIPIFGRHPTSTEIVSCFK